MLVSDFDFELPDALIAQNPSAERGGSRMLVLDRSTGSVEHRAFSAFHEYLTAGDLLVLNNTRVFPARLLGHRVPSGGAVECLLLSPLPEPGAPDLYSQTPVTQPRTPGQLWSALMHPGQKLKPGARVVFEGDRARLHGEVLGYHHFGRRTIRLWADEGSIADAIDCIGHIPLPPYIAREDTPMDRDRYQTVFARHQGSIAAPTAGLHFTRSTLESVRSRGVEIAEVTLHVGYGTFKPVRVNDVESHEVDPESFAVTAEAADALNRARRAGRRIIAVGTTTTRVLESLEHDRDGGVLPSTGETRAFIYPGHRFQIVDGLLTNFHLPRSSLLMLVAAFAGREYVLNAYRQAVAERYRFYSYGDAMFIHGGRRV